MQHGFKDKRFGVRNFSFRSFLSITLNAVDMRQKTQSLTYTLC